jgi:hypothetical protein
MTIPGALLFLFGAILVLSGVAGPFEIFGARFDIHYMVLGLTLAMLGMPALSMGIAVHAIMPANKLRKTKYVGSIDRWFTFDGAAMVGALLFVPGFLCDLGVLVHWLLIQRGHLTPMHTRLALTGALLIAAGFQSLLLGLLVGSARSALAPRVFR